MVSLRLVNFGLKINSKDENSYENGYKYCTKRRS